MARKRTPVGIPGTISLGQSHDGVWMARAYVWLPDGNRHRLAGTGVDPEAAETALRTNIQRKVQSVQSPFFGILNPTVGDLIDMWERTVLPSLRVAESTGATYGQHSIALRKLVGRISVDRLSIEILEDALIGHSKAAPARTQDLRKHLVRILKFARSRGYSDLQQPEDITIPAYTPPRDERGMPLIYTPSEVQQLFELAEAFEERTHLGARIQLPVTVYLAVLLGTGLRQGEAIGLHWNSFCFETRHLRVERSVTYLNNAERVIKGPKTDSGYRTLVVPEFTADHLKKLFSTKDRRATSPSTPIFASRDGDYLRASSIRRTISKVVQGTDLEAKKNVSQVARRTVASVISGAYGRQAAEEQLGHKGVGTAAVHYVVTPELRDDYSAPLQSLLVPPKGAKSEEPLVFGDVDESWFDEA